MAKKGMAAGVTVRLTPFPRRKNDLVRGRYMRILQILLRILPCPIEHDNSARSHLR
jgi:hypothetical protein